MKGIALFDRAELDAMVTATRKEAGGDFAPAYLRGIAENLKIQPWVYRSFGPYWWLLKRELIGAGFTDFGDEVDAETAEALDYGSTELNLSACYVAQSHCIEQMNLYGHHHVVELATGEAVEYVLVDEQVEAIEVGRLIQAGMQVH